MSDPDVVQTTWDTIILMEYGGDIRDWTFPVKSTPPTRTGRTKVFPTRQTVGPPNPTRDDTLSTLNVMDLSGGMGVYAINPSTDGNKYWWGVGTFTGTDGWTGAREVTSAQPAVFSGNCVPLGNIGDQTYALWGTDVHQWDPDTETWTDSLGDVGTVVNAEGIAVFQRGMYFPKGSGGYSWAKQVAPGDPITVGSVAGAATPTYSTGADPTTNPRVWAFAVHKQKLHAITTRAEGYALAITVTGDSNDWLWPADTANETHVKIQGFFDAYTMVSFPTPQMTKGLHLLGDSGMLIYNSNDTTWEETNLIDVPPHPDFGKAAKIFRPGEALWVAAGGGDVIQYTSNGNIVPASGPGGANEGMGGSVSYGQGMPPGKRASVLSFASDLAHLYGLFKGERLTPEEPSIVEDTEGGDALSMAEATAMSSVIAQTGKGWHPVWETPIAEAEPTRIAVGYSTLASGKRVLNAFWGIGEVCYRMSCRLYTHSARQAVKAGIGERFATTTPDEPDRAGYIEWGEYDAGAISNKKLFSHIAIHMIAASESDYVEVQYYTDSSTTATFQTLAAATADATDGTPRIVMPFGMTGDGMFSEGVADHWMRLKLRWVTTNPTTPAIVKALSLAYMPLPADAATKTYTVPLPVDLDKATNQTADQITNKLVSLVRSEKFLYMQEGQKKFRAYVASVSFAMPTTTDIPGALTLVVIQIPSGLPGLTGED